MAIHSRGISETPAPAADSLAGEADRRVSTLELFFDLVFVFTLTQLTHLLAEDLTLVGMVRVLLALATVPLGFLSAATQLVALVVLFVALLLVEGRGGPRAPAPAGTS